MAVGMVVYLKEKCDFGIIESRSQRSLFVFGLCSDLNIKYGDKVRFDIQKKPTGPFAVNIFKIDYIKKL